MAYNTESLVKLSALQELAQRVNSGFTSKTDFDSLKETVDNDTSEANVIDSISVNGTVQTVTNKSVDIIVPTTVSDLTNDSGFQTESDVQTAIATAISGTGHASFAVAESVPTADEAEENVLYLVMNSATSHYDIYAKVSGEVVLIDDTTVDLTDYVQKEDGKQLSSNDYTDEEKAKLATVEENANNYTHPTYTAQSSGFYKITVDATGHVSAVTAVTKSDITGLGIPESDTTYEEATTTSAGLMSASDKTKLDGIEIATDDEVSEMLDTALA